jgi:hypothetical protein
MRHLTFALATNGSGVASTTATRRVLGKLYAIAYRPGTIDTGATLTVTAVGVQTTTLVSLANAGTSNIVLYPRDLQHGTSNGAALTGTAGGDRCLPIIDGLLTVAIASGAASKAGAATIYFEE